MLLKEKKFLSRGATFAVAPFFFLSRSSQNLMKAALLIFLGSGLGGVARHYINQAVSSRIGSILPFGILSANVLACLLIGLLAGLASTKAAIPPNTSFCYPSVFAVVSAHFPVSPRMLCFCSNKVGL